MKRDTDLQSQPKVVGTLELYLPHPPLINVGKYRVFSNKKGKITCLSTLKVGGGGGGGKNLLSLMSRIKLKYCLISTSYLVRLFNIFILLHI